MVIVCCPAIYRLQLGRTWQILAFYKGQIVVCSFTDSIMNFKRGHKLPPSQGESLKELMVDAKCFNFSCVKDRLLYWVLLD